jgi:hypothetical protein
VQNVIHPAFLLIAVAATLLPSDQTQALAALAAIGAAVGLAALQADPAGRVAALPAGYLAVEAALLGSGATLALVAAVAAVRSGRTGIGLVGQAAAAGGGIGMLLTAAPYWAAAPGGSLLVALPAVLVLALGLYQGARFVGLEVVPADPAPRALPALAAIAVGALLAGLGLDVGLVFGGALMATLGGWSLRRSSGPRALPLAPVLALLLVPTWWLMATIAGPEGLAVGSLPDLPWSPAAERLLALALLLATWGIAGLWPLHRQVRTALMAPVGALVLARVAIPAVPDGLDHWRPLALPLVLVGLWRGALARDRQASIVALAWVGLVTATPPGEGGAALLLLGGLALELARRLGSQEGPLALGLRVSAAILVAWGAQLTLEGGLRTEVVYTVLAGAALVAAVGRERRAQASTASAPRAAAPSA